MWGSPPFQATGFRTLRADEVAHKAATRGISPTKKGGVEQAKREFVVVYPTEIYPEKRTRPTTLPEILSQLVFCVQFLGSTFKDVS